ncbi:G-type lectin S-receptor-like serine/threonine-protein kinase SD1-1 [Cornus florida]|uniref:G-type lectin S-receptor-like serine/threonine-protein kinase SD1-1 n=1 Tax=Cornus florida TaxID=4283 RepID=UPI00289CDB93|nr:G-type lectin S-receptor-like serine/threonine-protein kinase SD1-1 [Cornus florida]
MNHNQKRKTLILIVVVSTASGLLVLSLLTWCIIKRRRKKRGAETKNEDIELSFFDLDTIVNATKNFCSTNIIGEGGFGPVYKGKLTTGHEIAVKRLLKNSGQDQNKGLELPWEKRFEIAMGISRGLLYLHQDSRLRIIHRDLKAGNILLDEEQSPKISDFGKARSFGRDQIVAKTKRLIGTYGYMSLEYAIDGKFSVKSDVFSLGMLLLEMVSDKRNGKFHHPDHYHSLLGHAWLLWNEHKALELMDPCLENSYIESQVLRCIQVALLYVQKLSKDRPIMSSVVFMLSNEGVTFPHPKEPGFFVERSSIDEETSTSDGCHSGNKSTMTIMEGR